MMSYCYDIVLVWPIQDLELSSQKVQAGTGKMKYPTDDVCFLCKDGGDLLECDYVHRDLPVRRPCQRVYHRHCLPFVVPSKSKNWKCPRHYCDFCGNSKLRYMCKYCPMSACAACSKPGGSGKVSTVSHPIPTNLPSSVYAQIASWARYAMVYSISLVASNLARYYLTSVLRSIITSINPDTQCYKCYGVLHTIHW